MGATEWDGKERRTDDLSSVLYYRVELIEKKIEKFDDILSKAILELNTVKIETQAVAKSEGKLSGAIYGVGGSVLVTVLGLALGKVFG